MRADDTAGTAPADPETPVEAPPETGEAQEARIAKRKKLLRILAIVVVTIALLWGLWYVLTQAGRESTDTAYVGADSATVTALVSGPVAAVRVSGTQAVQTGDILVLLQHAAQRIALAAPHAAMTQERTRYGPADATAPRA